MTRLIDPAATRCVYSWLLLSLSPLAWLGCPGSDSASRADTEPVALAELSCAADLTRLDAAPAETVAFGDGSAGSCSADALRSLLANIDAGAVIGVHCPADTVVSLDAPLVTEQAFTLDGSASEGFVIDGQGAHRIFHLKHAPGTRDAERTRVVLRQLTLQNAFVSADSDSESKFAGAGGAIRTGLKIELLVEGVTFRGNRARNGGAIWIHIQNVPSITASTFIANEAEERGGAINTNSSRDHGASPDLQNERDGDLRVIASYFQGNVAGQGGAIRAVFHDAYLEGNVFIGNRAEDRTLSEGELPGAGAVLIEGTSSGTEAKRPGSAIVLKANRFFDNSAAHMAGALLLWPYDRDVVEVDDAIFADNSVSRASATDSATAGAFTLQHGFAGGTVQATLSRLSFARNRSEGGAGALWLAAKKANSTLNVELRDAVFVDNSSGLNEDEGGGGGGALRLANHGRTVLDELQVRGNTAYHFDGGAIYVLQQEADPADITLSNSAFEDNCATVKVDGGFPNGNQCEFQRHSNVPLSDGGGNREAPPTSPDLPGWKAERDVPLTPATSVEAALNLSLEVPNAEAFCG